VNAIGCHTFEDFKDVVISEIRAVPKVYIAELYQRLPKRMAAVIQAEGEKTKYCGPLVGPLDAQCVAKITIW